MMERVLTVGTITLATTCVLLVMKALQELLNLPFRAIAVLVSRLGDLLESARIDGDAIQVPTFYSPPIDEYEFFGVLITTVIVATLFGGIHCAGWNFPFLSHAELIIWRVSSLIIVIVPWTFVPPFVALWMGLDSHPRASIIIEVSGVLSLSSIVIYVLARLTLFVEAFTALRHLTPGAYAVVKWTSFLLHM